MKKITQTLTFLLLIGLQQSFAQTTAIPDANFENKLIALGIDTNGANGNILNSDALAVTELDVYNSNISDLTGIEAFTNLTLLRCDSNTLSCINVTQNTLLTSLDCSDNDIQEIDVSQNTQLTYLHLDNNNLQELSVFNNTQLELLFCRNNNLQTLTFSNFEYYPSLENIYCSHNEITALDLSYVTSLRMLDCNYNQIQTIDFSTNINLEELYCSDNQITSLNLVNNTNLTNLSCRYNQIITLNVSQNINLDRLYCNHNQISYLDLSTNTELTRINATENLLLELDLRNINQANITDLHCTYNPNLSCVYVDDVSYFTTNWADAIDATATYVADEAACSALAIDNFNVDTFTLYPNPTQDSVYLTTTHIIDKVVIYDSLGKEVMNTVPENNQFNIKNLEAGTYFVHIIIEGQTIVKEIVKE